MIEFHVEVKGIIYTCKSDGTALANGRSGDRRYVFVLRGFIEVNGKSCVLKEIGNSAFCLSSIESIGIPSNVEKIGEWCFSRCESLSEMIFESGSKLKDIGNSAFSDSGIKSIRIPSNVEKIGKCCFSRCESLSEMIFESGSKLKEIICDAFSD
jgi:hypothetical protein